MGESNQAKWSSIPSIKFTLELKLSQKVTL